MRIPGLRKPINRLGFVLLCLGAAGVVASWIQAGGPYPDEFGHIVANPNAYYVRGWVKLFWWSIYLAAFGAFLAWLHNATTARLAAWITGHKES